MNNSKLLEELDTIIEKYDNSQERLIQILLDLQSASGHNFLPEECLTSISKKLNLPLSKIYEVASFYSMFNHAPKGKYIIEICNSAPCHVCGAKDLTKTLEDILEIKIGETTADGIFSIQHSSCFGACDISPAIKIATKVYGNLNEEKIKEIIEKYRGEK